VSLGRLELLRFCCRFERSKSAVPESVEVAAHHLQTARVYPVDAAGPLSLVRHEASLLQHLEVLRHCRARHREALRELPHVTGSIREALEDLPSSGVGESRERGGDAERLVSHHLRKQ
jgi:hypothetical protein